MLRTIEAPWIPTSSSRETTDKVSPRRLSDQVSNVEDRGGGAELLAVETHGLLHSENLGVVQSGFATSTVTLSKLRFSSTRARMYGLLKVLQSPIDAKRWSIPSSGNEQLLPRNSLGHQEKRQDEPIDSPENSLVLSGSLAERARTDRARQSTMTSFHINGRLITTHDLRHLFTPLILGNTDISAGILVHLRDGVGDFESLPVVIVSLLSIDCSDIRLGDVGLLTIKLRLSAGHLGRGATVEFDKVVQDLLNKVAAGLSIDTLFLNVGRPSRCRLYILHFNLPDPRRSGSTVPRGAIWGHANPCEKVLHARNR